MRLRRKRLRNANLRAKVAALLTLVCGLWVFAAWVTTRDGANLIFVQTLNSKVFVPSEPLLLELQQERRLTQEYLGKPTVEQRAALDAERQRNIGLAAEFQREAQDWQARTAGSGTLKHRISLTVTALDGLQDIRAAVDSQTIDRAAAAVAYTSAINSIFQVYDALGQLDDKQITHDTAALIQLQRTRELISQEDALLAGIISTGKITAGELVQFSQLVGAQRYLGGASAAALSDTDRVRYAQEWGNEAGLRAVEDRVVQSSRAGAAVPTTAAEWRSAVDSALAGLHDVISLGGKDIVARATPVAVWVLVRAAVAAGLGLLAVIAAIVVSIATLRDLAARLRRLRSAAHDLADQRLPGLVVRLSRGDKVDVATEAPPLNFGDDEIGQVGQAFNAVQETAVRAAVEQAELRRSVRDVFLSLARRSQALVHRQLQLLDVMERRESDADELADLFAVDHLATRMRRNAENLIVLSGAVAGRGWRNPVPLVDVVRGALAEVEDYTRVTVLPVESAALAGRAVGDVIHLLAELIENAVSFSPPYTTVQVGGSRVANGFVVEIEDRGLGLSESDLVTANEQLAEPPEFNLTSTAKLGLFVVGRLAARHGIKVRLRESPYGGTTAIVLIPSTLVVNEQDAGVGVQRPGRLALQYSPTSDSGQLSGIGTARQPAAIASASAPSAGESTSDGGAAGTAPEVGLAERWVPAMDVRGAGRHAAAHDQPAFGSWDAPVPQPEATTPDAPPPWPPQPRTPLPIESDPQPADSDAVAMAAEDDDGEPVIYTPVGLPWRRRQASLATQLRDEPAEVTVPDDAAPVRPPEEIRRMMSSYQSGTRRGRSDADQAANWYPEPTTPAPVPPQWAADVTEPAAENNPAVPPQHPLRPDPADRQQS